MARQPALRKTKVVATIGPACDDLETIKAMIRSGMNVARLNFSHGTQEEHRKRIEMLEEATRELGANVATMLDTRGREVRTGRVAGGSALLGTGDSFTLYTDGRIGDARGVSVTLRELPDDVSPGSPILLDDGVIELRVLSVETGAVHCEVTRGGRLRDRKSVNVPESSFTRVPLDDENRRDLAFAVKHDITYIAASFVRSAADVLEIRQIVKDFGGRIPIIAKIESREAVRHLDEIVSVANGTMVARGDLGVEVPLPDVPMVQKRIIRTTVMNGKPVITATQMLDSMERNPTPTRAEVSDVANAILDGTSAVMLSGETAAGSYPVEAVRTMAALAFRAEASLREYGHLQKILPEPINAITEAVGQAAITMAHHLDAAVMIALTESGFTARSISKHRPDCPIVALTVWSDVERRLALNWGVTALRYEGERDDEKMVAFALRRCREFGYVQPGDVAVVTAGRSQEAGSTNMIRVVTA